MIFFSACCYQFIESPLVLYVNFVPCNLAGSANQFWECSCRDSESHNIVLKNVQIPTQITKDAKNQGDIKLKEEDS